MRGLKARILRALLVMALAGAAMAPAAASHAEEAGLRERASALYKQIRCLVCRNESIDESSAPLARDLRLLVDERLAMGDSDEEVKLHLVDRYGEYVLLEPRATGVNILLWLSGPALISLAFALAVAYLRRRRPRPEPSDLSAEERRRLKALTERSF